MLPMTNIIISHDISSHNHIICETRTTPLSLSNRLTKHQIKHPSLFLCYQFLTIPHFFLFPLFHLTDDYKVFREAAFVELEFLKNSELNIQSTSEALEILYQPHEEIFSEDDDNFFLFLDDKNQSFFSMRSTTPDIPMTKKNDDTIDLFGKSKLIIAEETGFLNSVWMVIKVQKIIYLII